MRRETFRHLDREWEAAIPDADGERLWVRLRREDDGDPRTYEAELSRAEVEDDGIELRLALRRALESVLVLDALEGHDVGLTAEEVGRMTGMPRGAAQDRLEILEEVRPVLGTDGPRRYRAVDGA